MTRVIGKLFEREKLLCKFKRVNNFWNNTYTEHESDGDKNRSLWLDEYLNKMKPYLRNIINHLQNSDTWKIQLTTAINFSSSRDSEGECVMHWRSNNIKFTSYDYANEVVDELFEPLLSRYQGNLEKSMRKSDFIID